MVAIDLAHPIGSYKKPEPVIEHKDEPVKVDPKKKPVDGKHTSTFEYQKYLIHLDKKPQPAIKKPGSPPLKPESRGATKGKVEIHPEPVLPKQDPGAIFERAVYIFPYKSHSMVQKLQHAVAKINMEGLGNKDGNVLLLILRKV